MIGLITGLGDWEQHREDWPPVSERKRRALDDSAGLLGMSA